MSRGEKNIPSARRRSHHEGVYRPSEFCKIQNPPLRPRFTRSKRASKFRPGLENISRSRETIGIAPRNLYRAVSPSK